MIGRRGSRERNHAPIISASRRQTHYGRLCSAAGGGLDVGEQDDILLRGIYLGIEAGEIRRKMQDVIEFTELVDHLLMPVQTCSIGMLSRPTFATSTAFTPDILLDEVISRYMSSAKSHR